MLVCSWQTRKGSASQRKNRRENERTKHGKRNVKKRKKKRSTDGVVFGRGRKRRMEDDLGDDQMQTETEEIAEE